MRKLTVAAVAATLLALSASTANAASPKLPQAEAKRLTRSLITNESVAESVFQRPLTETERALGLRGTANDEAVTSGKGHRFGRCVRKSRSRIDCGIMFEGFGPDGRLVRTLTGVSRVERVGPTTTSAAAVLR
jgi:hypothetical protein